MSFDLFFCSQKNAPIHFGTVVQWSKKYPAFNPQDNQLSYSNEDTGVYFSLDFDADDSIAPEGYLASGLSFNLNYNRPRYFAYESMPIVVDLCKNFGFYVFNPQTTAEHEISANPEVTELTNSWLSSNQNAISAMRKHGAAKTLIMPSEKSTYMWKYCFGKRELQTELGNEIFVPSLVPLRKSGSSIVGTMIVCAVTTPMVLPNSDWVILSIPKEKLISKNLEYKTSVMSRKAFEDTVGSFMSPLGDDNNLQIIDNDFAEMAANQLKAAKNILPTQEFEAVARDEFIEIDDTTADIVD